MLGLRKRLEREPQEAIMNIDSAIKSVDNLLLELEVQRAEIPFIAEEHMQKYESRITPEQSVEIKTKLIKKYQDFIDEKIGELREEKGSLKLLVKLGDYLSL
jgi:hypothetical protein